MHKIRVYIDTSVFGGVHDEEFAEASKRFFERVRLGECTLLISEETVRELLDAPESVRTFWENLPSETIERVSIGEKRPMNSQRHTSKPEF